MAATTEETNEERAERRAERRAGAARQEATEELVDILGGLDAIGVTRLQARAVRDSRSVGSDAHSFWAWVADGLLESGAPAPDVPAHPTHQDVANAVRARIVAAAEDLEVEETGLAALVTAYNGTDSREPRP